jgi:hypothetical protein
MSETVYCEWGKHEWKEVYYGTECKLCGMFFAHGQAPWDAEPDEYHPHWMSESFDDFDREDA